MHTIAVGALVALSTSVLPVDGNIAAAPGRPWLSLPEILQRMKESPVEYRLSTLDKLKDVPPSSFSQLLWPELVPPAQIPKLIRDPSGRLAVAEWPVKPETEEPLGEAEALYDKKDFEGAAKKYRAVLEIDPKFYLVHAGLGDCALFSDKAAAALEHYDRAIELNPDDYRLHFYRGNALARLGRTKEAVESFVTSLVLKPRNPILLGHLRKNGQQWGIKVQDELFVPRAFVRKEGRAVAVYADSYWLGWAACKAYWMGETTHRQEMTGSSAPGWSTLEEMECLVALIGAHEVLGAKDGSAPNPAIDKLAQAVKDKLAGAFAVYELGSRLDPQIGLKLDPASRYSVRRYVKKYVLGIGD